MSFESVIFKIDILVLESHFFEIVNIESILINVHAH